MKYRLQTFNQRMTLNTDTKITEHHISQSNIVTPGSITIYLDW